MSTSGKFVGEQDVARHGGDLQWPGINGIPLRGPTPITLRKQELQKVPLVLDARQKSFDLNDEKDAAEYAWIRERIRNGWFYQDYIKRRWSRGKKYPIVYLEWVQVYHELSSAMQSQWNGSPNAFTLRS